MHGISPDEFLATVFPPDLLLPDERICVAYPDSFVSRETGERVDYYRQMHWRPGVLDADAAWYFCVSTVAHQRRRQIKKRLEDVRTAFVLVVDDVLTKSKAPDVAPSYVLETSPGNQQWGYLIEPYAVYSDAGASYYDRCLMSLAAGGFNDPGFRSANRLARTPGSMRVSGRADYLGFKAGLLMWAPRRTWELPDLMAEFGVPMVDSGRRSHGDRVPGTVERIADVRDPLYDWLQVTDRVYGHNHDFVFIDCPWRAGHTDGKQGPTATGFSPYGYGKYQDRGFRCLHGHCAGYTIRHFEEWARKQGAVIDLPGVV